MLRLCKGEGNEGRRTADFCFSPGLGGFFFFMCPNSANGKAALCLPECSQCIQFPVQRARARKQKQTGSEGRRKWEVTEVRA